jgi:hypothetical protein
MWVRASTPHGVAVKSGASWPGMDRRARRQNIMSSVRTLPRPAELDAAGAGALAALARAGADQLEPVKKRRAAANGRYADEQSPITGCG